MNNLYTIVESGDNLTQEMIDNTKLGIDSLDGSGEGLIHYAAEYGRINSLKLLIKNKADVNLITWFHGETPLYKAITNKHFDAAKLLLKAGANIDIGMKEKEEDNEEKLTGVIHSILELEVGNNRMSSIQFILDNGADINIKNESGWSPFLSAINMGYKNIVQTFMDNGVDTSYIYEKGGLTPFNAAVYNSNLEITQILIDGGADIILNRDRSLEYLSRNIKMFPNAAEWNKIFNIVNGTMYGRRR